MINDCLVYFMILGFCVHNGHLVGKEKLTNYGRSYYRLKIVTPRGKIIFVRRYDDEKAGQGEFPYFFHFNS